MNVSNQEVTMATKANFTPDEWKIVLGSPMLAGLAVTLAEPSGIWGMIREGMASSNAMLQAKTDAGATELAKALVADMETSEGRSVAQDGLKSELTAKSPAELKQQVIAALNAARTDSRCEGTCGRRSFQEVAESYRGAGRGGGF
jgi:hypothetical protein